MTEKEIVKAAMKAKGFTYEMLRDALGYTSSVGSIADRVNRGNSMRCDTLVKFLNVMGFEVIVRSKNKDEKDLCWRVKLDEGGSK